MILTPSISTWNSVPFAINFLTKNLGKNATRLSKYQNQVSTGKRIQKLSDDPVGASYSIRYNTDIEKENRRNEADTAFRDIGNDDDRGTNSTTLSRK